MSVSDRIVSLLEAGYKPADIVKMGFPKSTVYTVYRRWIKRKVGGNSVYIAYDIDYATLSKFIEQLRSLDPSLNVIVGSQNDEDIEIVRHIPLVIALIGRKEGWRRHLLLRELRLAGGNQRLVVFVEEGAYVPYLPENALIINFNRANITATLSEMLRKLGNRTNDVFFTILGVIAIAFIVALGIGAIVELLKMFLGTRSKNT